MRTLYLFTIIYIGLTLTSCAAINAEKVEKTPTIQAKTITPPAKTSLKNPMAVSFYQSEPKFKHPYKILGTETVSKYNTVGIKRQEATIKDTMRKIAAIMGGDAIIHVNRDNQAVSGTVISFDKENSFV